MTMGGIDEFQKNLAGGLLGFVNENKLTRAELLVFMELNITSLAKKDGGSMPILLADKLFYEELAGKTKLQTKTVQKCVISLSKKGVVEVKDNDLKLAKVFYSM